MKFNLNKLNKGFTLIELLVIITIMSILLMYSVADYNAFGKNIELDNDIYVVAITLREAQVYGINKRARTNQNIEFGDKYKYGAFFARTSENITALDDKHFIMYIDGYRNICNTDDEGNTQETKCKDGFTDHGTDNCLKTGEDECYSKIKLKRGNSIRKLMVKNSNGLWSEVNQVDVSFERPTPDAIIKSGATVYSGARIVIQEPAHQYYKCVEIDIPGGINIKNNCD